MIDKKCLYCTEAHEYADRDENNAMLRTDGNIPRNVYR